MKAPWWIMLAFLAAAILLALLAESRRFQPPNRVGPVLCQREARLAMAREG
jgi:hypothetical protein